MESAVAVAVAEDAGIRDVAVRLINLVVGGSCLLARLWSPAYLRAVTTDLTAGCGWGTRETEVGTLSQTRPWRKRTERRTFICKDCILSRMSRAATMVDRVTSRSV